jgi:glycogen(starch) synthase
VTISRQLRDELITKGLSKDNIHVVPNGVDTQIFKPQTKNKGLLNQYGLDKKTVFGFIGSIRKIEGLSLFLRHLPELINKHNNIRVMLVGDGAEVGNLKRITSEYGLDDYVIFTGRVNHDQILDYYSIIDVFIYPRIDARVNHKVTPLKPLEAMAMEKVVIASDVGGLRELIDDERTGLLFKVDDGRSLVEKCLFAIENNSFRSSLGKQARQWTVQERDWTKIIKLYNEVYSKLLLQKNDMANNKR